MKYLLILVLIFSVVISSASALLVAKTDQELYNEHDVILIGTVIKADGRLFERITDYSIAVEKYLKNDLGQEVHLSASGKKDSNVWVEDETIFEKGDKVLLYLVKNADTYQISPYSHVLEDGAEPVIITKVELWSPPTFAEEVNLCQDGKTLGPWAYQWIELHNLRNETTTITGDIELNLAGSVMSFTGPFTLGPKESCLIQTADQITTRIGPGGSEGNGPPNGYDGSSITIQYTVKTDDIITKYQDSTPELSDTFGDARVWQLIDGKWVFKEYLIPDVNRTTLTKTTDDGAITVNLTLAEEIQPPSMTKFRVSFMDSAKNPLNNVKYEITYSGGNQVEQTDNGFASNGTEIKFMEFTQPGSLKITISILGVDEKTFDKPQNVEFSTIVIPEFPIALPILVFCMITTLIITRTKWIQYNLKIGTGSL